MEGRFSRTPMIEMTLPSSLDKTLAPPGEKKPLTLAKLTIIYLKVVFFFKTYLSKERVKVISIYLRSPCVPVVHAVRPLHPEGRGVG